MRPFLILTLLAVAAAVGPVANLPAADADKDRDSQDVVYLSDKGPLLLRLHLRLDGKAFRDVWDDFITAVFQHLDTNNDGTVNAVEAKKTPLAAVLMSGGFFGGGNQSTILANLDANKDGKVSKEELAKYYLLNGAPPLTIQGGNNPNEQLGAVYVQGGARPPTADELNKAFFELVDADKDGKLSRSELTQAPPLVQKRDADDDEMVAVREMTGAPANPYEGVVFAQPVMAQQVQNSAFVLAGTDNRAASNLARQIQGMYGPKGQQKDKKLSAKDLGMDKAVFAQLDVDEDGLLDTEELRFFAKRDPDLELTVRLGKLDRGQKAVELMTVDGKQTPLAAKVRSGRDGVLVLDLGTTQVELRAGSPGNAYGSVAIAGIDFKTQFKMADGDNNGYLDRKEAQRNGFFNNLFATLDANDDGMLFEKEMLDYVGRLEKLQAKAAAGCTTLAVSDEGRGVFDLVDRNRDQRLGVRELRNAVNLIDDLDRDGDSMLGKDEMPRRYAAGFNRGAASGLGGRRVVRAFGMQGDAPLPNLTEGPMWFRKMDRNRDGDVSRREFLGTDEAFKRLDADGDGLVSADEAARADAELRNSEKPQN